MIPFLLAAFAAAAPPAHADEAKVVRQTVGGLFEGLRKDSAVRAAAAVEGAFRLGEEEKAAFVGRLHVLLRTAGALQTWKVIEVRRMPGGDRWRTALAVSHHARRPVAWAVQLYRVEGGRWTVLEIAFDADDPATFLKARGAPSAQ